MRYDPPLPVPGCIQRGDGPNNPRSLDANSENGMDIESPGAIHSYLVWAIHSLVSRELLDAVINELQHASELLGPTRASCGSIVLSSTRANLPVNANVASVHTPAQATYRPEPPHDHISSCGHEDPFSATANWDSHLRSAEVSLLPERPRLAASSCHWDSSGIIIADERNDACGGI